MESPFFSIIVPVYNVEEYITKCIESVLCQKYYDYELILVDDGSSDKSGKICDEISLTDNRIVVVHKENGGLSSARNLGVDISKGKYNLFLDSDDYFADSGLLQSLFKRISEYNEDLILYSTNDVFSKGNIVPSISDYNIDIINQHNKSQTIDYLYSSGKFPGAAWICCVKRKILKDNHIDFPLDVTAEDYVWILKVLHVVKNIGACNQAVVNHLREVSGSITSKPRVSGIYGINICLDYYLKHIHTYKWSIGIRNHMSFIYLIELSTYDRLDSSQKKAIKNDVICRSNVLGYGTDLKSKIATYCVKIFGVDLSAKLINFIRYNIWK